MDQDLKDIFSEMFIAAVKAHAIANYEKDGWDIVVESYSDNEIAELVKTARTIKGAIKMVRTDCKAHADYSAEIESTAF